MFKVNKEQITDEEIFNNFIFGRSGIPSIDIETRLLKKMIEKRSQLFDTLANIMERYDQSAKNMHGNLPTAEIAVNSDEVVPLFQKAGWRQTRVGTSDGVITEIDDIADKIQGDGADALVHDALPNHTLVIMDYNPSRDAELFEIPFTLASNGYLY